MYSVFLSRETHILVYDADGGKPRDHHAELTENGYTSVDAEAFDGGYLRAEVGDESSRRGETGNEHR